MADLASNFCGIKSPNPFWLASAPPTDKEYNVRRAFEAGWGGVVWKTLGVEGPPIVNVNGRGEHVARRRDEHHVRGRVRVRLRGGGEERLDLEHHALLEEVLVADLGGGEGGVVRLDEGADEDERECAARGCLLEEGVERREGEVVRASERAYRSRGVDA